MKRVFDVITSTVALIFLLDPFQGNEEIKLRSHPDHRDV
jgi:hypothetical protein